MKIKTIQLNIKGMTCDSCATSIEKQLNADGIMDKNVSYKEAGAKITFDEDKISRYDIDKLVNKTKHYEVTGSSDIEESSGNKKHLIIIGGGSAAFAATIQAREMGVKVTMVNDGLPIGGTCVNVGCVPSKNLIRAAEEIHRAQNTRFEGIEGNGRLTDFKKVIEQKTEMVKELRQGKYIDVVKDMEDFRQIKGYARITSPTSIEVNGETIQGNNIFVATGARPHIPNIKGLTNVPYLDNESAFELKSLPKSIIVLGGRYIALEIAQMFSRLGSKVIVLQRSNRILPTETEDLTNELTEHLENEGLDIVTGNQFQRVYEENKNIVVESKVANKLQKFKSEKIIVATGRTPNSNDMGLEEVGVKLDEKGFIEVNDYLQTSVPTINAVGDVIGKNMFVYTAAYEGKLAVSNIYSPIKKESDYTALPWVIFTDPQVAGVGLDEAQAIEQNIDYDVAKLPLSYVPRAIAARDTRGFIKLIRNKQTDQLIGARILAPEGSELLMEVATAIKFGITVEQLKEIFHPYLTLSEGIKLAAITFKKDVSELSCCTT